MFRGPGLRGLGMLWELRTTELGLCVLVLAAACGGDAPEPQSVVVDELPPDDVDALYAWVSEPILDPDAWVKLH